MVRAASAATAATSRSSMELPFGQSARRTLIGVKLQVQPGELLAVVGEVGAGKSSLLAALLGELMPMRSPDGAVHGKSRLGVVSCGASIMLVSGFSLLCAALHMDSRCRNFWLWIWPCCAVNDSAVAVSCSGSNISIHYCTCRWSCCRRQSGVLQPSAMDHGSFATRQHPLPGAI
jgi:energy-coupling factor transporter ATP-binding protein EcfA2